jgi:hypothetical protein
MQSILNCKFAQSQCIQLATSMYFLNFVEALKLEFFGGLKTELHGARLPTHALPGKGTIQK